MGKIETAALQTQQTNDEIKFIRDLGRQKVPATAGVPRAELLRGYLAGCQKRERWDGIDRARVMAFAEVGAGDTATEGHNDKGVGLDAAGGQSHTTDGLAVLEETK